MSRIYFHAPHRDAEVGGSERAYFGGMASDLALSILGVNASRDQDWAREITVDPPDYIATALNTPAPDVMTDPEGYRRWARWTDTWSTHMRVGGSGLLVGDSAIPFMELALNTLVAMNSPQLSFMAHVHGLCESHIYVEAENAEWMADLIAKAREDEVFRAGQGWEDVIALAQEVAASGEGPIVLSYSVCEGFPNAEVANWTPADESDEGWDAWYALSADERWDMGVRALREADWPFAMGPDRQGQGFLSGKSVFDLKAERWTGQLAPRVA
jgi:hypothetical protein